MLIHLLHYIFLILHTIAPVAILTQIAVIVWFLVMGRKWKREDPERWNS
jgi:hypothetical protein